MMPKQLQPAPRVNTPAPAPQKLQSFGMTDVGTKRAVNEDAFAADDASQLYIVADGMGGHGHGDVASKIAIQAMLGHVAGGEDAASTVGGMHPHTRQLKRSIEVAHARILDAMRADYSLLGMGTTVVSAMLRGPIMAIAHVGDSRAYRRRAGQLEQLTRDHSWVHEADLSEAQARNHPLGNVVTRALGGAEEIKVDVLEVKARPGDLYLLCTDGLTAMLEDRYINRLLAAIDTPRFSVSLEEICEALIHAANTLGGVDNTTVVLVQVVSSNERKEESCR